MFPPRGLGAVREEEAVRRIYLHEGRHACGEGTVDQEVGEVLVVVGSDAVVDPETVRLHFEHAQAALFAVVGPLRLPHLALEALPVPAAEVSRFLEIVGQVARVGEGGSEPVDD